MNGYIVLFRSLLQWEWYSDVPVKTLFIHLLLKANYQEKRWRGITIPRGSMVTSRAKLSAETGLSEQQVRTAIKKLESTNDIAKCKKGNYTLIKVINYDRYQLEQPIETPTDNQAPTKLQPDTNQGATTTNKVNKENKENKEKKEKKKGKPVKHRHGEYGHVMLTDDEFRRLQKDFPFYGALITKLDEYLETSGKSYRNHNLVLRGWVLKWYHEHEDEIESGSGGRDNGSSAEAAFSQDEFDSLYSELQRGEL